MPPGGTARTSARNLIKASVRGAGMATSSWRPPPDFLVIGTKRGGTTSFYFDLLEHPGIVRLFPPPVPLLKSDATKGVHYFDSNYGRTLRWYRSHFPTSATRAITSRRSTLSAVSGEASPYYMFHPAGAQRVHRALPDVRLIVLLRHPVERAYSHWKERRRGQAEVMDFLDAIDAEPARLRGERERLLADPTYVSYAWEQQSYVTQSRYAASLYPWVDLFGRDRILAISSESYYRDPVSALRTVDQFLGLPERTTSSGVVRNAASGETMPRDARRRLEEELGNEATELNNLLGQDFAWL